MTERSYIQVDNIRTAQVILGEGVPVLMLHGWGANIDLLLPLAQQLAPLGYKLFIPDLPGFGASDSTPSGWSVIDYANWTMAYAKCHGLSQFHLFGHSFGGRISLVLGAEHVNCIYSIVLANSAGVLSKPSNSRNLRLKTYRFALNILNTAGLQQTASQLRQWYNNRYGSPDYKAATGTLRETFIKVINHDLLPYAIRIKPSTLLLWGDQDEDTPLWQGQLLERSIPDAGLVVYEGAGHYSYLDRLSEVTRVIDHFFKHATGL